jgi:hypothetical protein
MNMQSTGNQQLRDLLNHPVVSHARRRQRDLPRKQIPQHVHFERLTFELLKPQATPQSTLWNIDPIGRLAVVFLAKPPFVLDRRKQLLVSIHGSLVTRARFQQLSQGLKKAASILETRPTTQLGN